MGRFSSNILTIAGLLLATVSTSKPSRDIGKKSVVSSTGIDGEELYDVQLPESRHNIPERNETEIATKHFIIKILSVKPKKLVTIREKNHQNVEVGEPLTRTRSESPLKESSKVKVSNSDGNDVAFKVIASFGKGDALERDSPEAAKSAVEASSARKSASKPKLDQDKKKTNATKSGANTKVRNSKALNRIDDVLASKERHELKVSNAVDIAKNMSAKEEALASKERHKVKVSNAVDIAKNLSAKEEALASKAIKDALGSNLEKESASLNAIKNALTSEGEQDMKISEVIKGAFASNEEKDAKTADAIKDALELNSQKDRKALDAIKAAMTESSNKDAKASDAIKNALKSNADQDATTFDAVKGVLISNVDKDTKTAQAIKDALQASKQKEGAKVGAIKEAMASNTATDVQLSNSLQNPVASNSNKDENALKAIQEALSSSSMTGTMASTSTTDAKKALLAIKGVLAGNTDDRGKDVDPNTIASSSMKDTMQNGMLGFSPDKDIEASSELKQGIATEKDVKTPSTTVRGDKGVAKQNHASEWKTDSTSTVSNAEISPDAIIKVKHQNSSNNKSSSNDKITEEDRETLKNAVLGEIFSKLSRGDYDNNKGMGSNTNSEKYLKLKAIVAKRGRLTNMFVRFLEDLAKKLKVDAVSVAERLINKNESYNDRETLKAGVRDVIPFIPGQYLSFVKLLRDKLKEEINSARILHA